MWYLYIVGFSCLIFPRNLPYRTICICWVISIHQASQKDKICHKKICRHSCFPFGAIANDWKQIMQELGVLSSVALNLFSWFGILNCLNCFYAFSIPPNLGIDMNTSHAHRQISCPRGSFLCDFSTEKMQLFQSHKSNISAAPPLCESALCVSSANFSSRFYNCTCHT